MGYMSLSIEFGSFWVENGVILATMRAINPSDDYEIGMPIHDKDSMRRIAGMVPQSSDEYFGCVREVDGWVCATRKPFNGETKFERKYQNRKGLWGIMNN